MTTEKRLNDRRNWKAETFPYDYYIPDDSRECSYCLTDKQAEILLGIIEPLAWKTRWWSDSDTDISKDEIEDFRADIAKRLMMSCCGDESPVRFRYLSDGTLQKSSDNGATWEDAPDFDPRNNSTVFPPLEVGLPGANKCDAATGMTTLIKEQIGEQLTDDMTRYTLGQLITDWVTTILQTSNPFTALLTIVTNQLFALVIAVVRPTLTDEVYGDLTCIFVDHMESDLSFDESDWNSVRDGITSLIGGIAGVFLEHLVYLLGPVGLTNLARSQVSTSADCNCTEYKDVFITPTGGTFISRVDEVLTASAIAGGPVGYILYLQFEEGTNPPDRFNCGFMTITTISGSYIGSTSVNTPCGGSTQFNNGLTPYNEICSNQNVLVSSVPFTVEVTGLDC